MARHVVELKPRWADMDAYGHVNNVTWLEYLQEARIDLFFVHAPTLDTHISIRTGSGRNTSGRR